MYQLKNGKVFNGVIIITTQKLLNIVYIVRKVL